MTDKVGKFAQILSGSNVVENTILMEEDFVLNGYTFIRINNEITCQPGSYYNETDGLFYDNAEFTLIAGSSNIIENP